MPYLNFKVDHACALTYVWMTGDVVVVVALLMCTISFFFHLKNNTRPIILIKRFYFVYELDNECARYTLGKLYYCLGDVYSERSVLCPKQAFTVKRLH